MSCEVMCFRFTVCDFTRIWPRLQLLQAPIHFCTVHGAPSAPSEQVLELPLGLAATRGASWCILVKQEWQMMRDDVSE